MEALNIRKPFSEVLVPVALKGLGAMCRADGTLCQTARRGPGGTLELVGQSPRYTAMALVGLAMQQRLGRAVDLPLDAMAGRLVQWCDGGDPSLADLGLVLWALAEFRHRQAPRLAQQLSKTATCQETLQRYESMGLGWLLAGLALVIEQSLESEKLRRLAELTCRLLLARRRAQSGLFGLGSRRFRKNVFKRRIASRLASFASQVYPTVGLAYYGRAAGSEQAFEAARHGADLLCRFQGPQGQWWWISDAATGVPVVKYPVYGVHQDGMGPMALLAVCLAGGMKDEYLLAVAESVAWLERHPELPAQPLVDPERGVVWRAIQRDPPDRTGAYGLGCRERLRMQLAAWTGLPDTRPFNTGYICDECRPYHLGWILAADAMAAEASQMVHPNRRQVE